MPDYKELAEKMESGSIVKAAYGDYIVYRRDYLHEHYEDEYKLQKSAAEFAKKFTPQRHRNIIEEIRNEIKQHKVLCQVRAEGSRGT